MPGLVMIISPPVSTLNFPIPSCFAIFTETNLNPGLIQFSTYSVLIPLQPNMVPYQAGGAYLKLTAPHFRCALNAMWYSHHISLLHSLSHSPIQVFHTFSSLFRSLISSQLRTQLLIPLRKLKESEKNFQKRLPLHLPNTMDKLPCSQLLTRSHLATRI